ncbi:MAG TPA: hypothetical protein VLT36_11805 [Candidatus Dormibacteraeota bacterium]|nr:hypothetical protein [Candidatus Dormibacteraeota bacterium]
MSEFSPLKEPRGPELVLFGLVCLGFMVAISAVVKSSIPFALLGAVLALACLWVLRRIS